MMGRFPIVTLLIRQTTHWDTAHCLHQADGPVQIFSSFSAAAGRPSCANEAASRYRARYTCFFSLDCLYKSADNKPRSSQFCKEVKGLHNRSRGALGAWLACGYAMEGDRIRASQCMRGGFSSFRNVSHGTKRNASSMEFRCQPTCQPFLLKRL